MVSDEIYAALHEQYAALQTDYAALREQWAQAVQRISELEAKKTPPASFVKANAPPSATRDRKRRAPEQNRARQRETAPTR